MSSLTTTSHPNSSLSHLMSHLASKFLRILGTGFNSAIDIERLKKNHEPICRQELWGRSFGEQDCSYLTLKNHFWENHSQVSNLPVHWAGLLSVEPFMDTSRTKCMFTLGSQPRILKNIRYCLQFSVCPYLQRHQKIDLTPQSQSSKCKGYKSTSSTAEQIGHINSSSTSPWNLPVSYPILL